MRQLVLKVYKSFWLSQLRVLSEVHCIGVVNRIDIWLSTGPRFNGTVVVAGFCPGIPEWWPKLLWCVLY